MNPKNNETKIDDVKKKIIISMCAIILLILTLFGITYAYFTTSVQGNKNDTSVEIGAALLKLEYNGENSYIELEGLLPGETIESKKFSVKNTGTATIENYDVILENLVNELNRYEDLTYKLTCTSSDGKSCNGSEDIFPKTNQVIVTNTIDSGVTHSYVLKLTYNETNTNQSIDMNKEISARVNIKDDYSDIKTFKIYGNTLLSEVQTRNLTPQNEIRHLGELVTDENDKNYGKYKIPITFISKNKFNKDISEFEGIRNESEYSGYGKIIYSNNNIIKMLKPNTKYTISYEVETISTPSGTPVESDFNPIGFSLYSGVTGYTNISMWKVNYDFTTGNIYQYKQTFTTPETLYDAKANYRLIAYSGRYVTETSPNVAGTVIFRNIQIEEGDIVSEYISYTETTSNVYLDDPLRKLGEVSDYIDLENKIVVRKVGEKVFDGTENIHTYENGVYYGLLHDYKIPAVSNYYSNNIEEEIHFTSTKNSNAIHFRVDETADEFNTLLKEKYKNNQPLRVLYALNELEYEAINVPDFEINNTNTINVCDTKDLCASNIEVEFDE